MTKPLPKGFASRAGWGAVVVGALAAVNLYAADGDQLIDRTISLASAQNTPVAPIPEYPTVEDPTVQIQAPPPSPVKAINTFSQIVSADVSTNGNGALDYLALILDRDVTDNLFIKVQGQLGSGKVSHLFFYHGNNNGGWTGMTGGSSDIALAPADQFTSARMTVIHDGLGNVTLQLSNVVGGTNNQSYTRGGWNPRRGKGFGFGGFASIYSLDNWGHDSICDNFDRPNGLLGPDWVVTDGTASIVGNTAHGLALSRAIYVGACSSGLAIAEADVAASGTNQEYCALALNSNGTNNLYIKVQKSAGATKFDTIGFYSGTNTAGWSGQTGGGAFISLPVAQQFSSAHMKLILEADGTVRLILTDMDSVVGPLEFTRGGWTLLNGHACGFGVWNSNSIVDNAGFYGWGIFDDFARPNGVLGINWQLVAGNSTIVNNTARGSGGVASLALFIGEPSFKGTCAADVAPPGGDSVVNVIDLLKILNNWGPCQ